MKREELLRQLKEEPVWDMIVVGGGATGLGTAVEAASRGYRTLLLEQSDFAKGTSSRSTKLIHGGVRYLQQGNLSLVLEALRERGLLIRNAPHLVHNLSFVVPIYDWWEGPFYGIGLKLYDLLAGKLGLGPSRLLSREETLRHIPTVEQNGLRGGVIYHDAQFDDARLAISLALTLADLGGVALNYLPVTGIFAEGGLVAGVEARDGESGREFRIKGRVVVNAAGPFVDNVRRMIDPDARGLITPSQGVHLVLEGSFLPGDSAIMVPHTDDGRVLFAVPWHGRTIVGTTDTQVAAATLEPRPLPEEIEFLLTHASRYLTRHPAPADVLSAFAGIRPLVRSDNSIDTAPFPATTPSWWTAAGWSPLPAASGPPTARWGRTRLPPRPRWPGWTIGRPSPPACISMAGRKVSGPTTRGRSTAATHLRWSVFSRRTPSGAKRCTRRSPTAGERSSGRCATNGRGRWRMCWPAAPGRFCWMPARALPLRRRWRS
jgi:glycerol-3-phosphate dehydrogenase